MLFAIDHGNSAVKTTNFVFTSGLAEYPVKPPLQTDVLEWGGKFWALSGQRISFMRDKTRDDRFFILTLFAIAMELRKMGQLQPMLSVELAVGPNTMAPCAISLPTTSSAAPSSSSSMTRLSA